MTRGLAQNFAKTASIGVVYAIWSVSLVLIAAFEAADICKKLEWDGHSAERLQVAALLLTLGALGAGLVQGMRRDPHHRSDAWLQQLPIDRRALAAGRLLSAGLGRPWLWLVVLPATTTLNLMLGRGILSLPAGLGSTLLVGIAVGTLGVAMDFGLERLGPGAGRLARMTAALIGYALLIASLLLFFASRHTLALELASMLPERALVSLAPVLFLRGGSAVLLGVGAMLVLAAGGLFVASRPGEARASKATRTRHRAWAARWVVTSELALLWAEPRELAQTLAPCVLASGLGSWLYYRSGGAPGAGQAALALGAISLGLYVVSVLALSCAVRKPERLWLLYQLPTDIRATLVKRALVGVPLAILVTLPLSIPALLASAQPVYAVSMSVVALSLASLLAGGLGVLASRPLQQEDQGRLRTLSSNLAFFAPYGLVALVVTSSAWLVALTLALYGLWTLGVWRRAGRHIPGLLDPSEPDLPRVRLSLFAVGSAVFVSLAVFVLARLSGTSLLETGALAVPAAGATANWIVAGSGFRRGS
ncbi:MAG: hypothetical protein GXP55_06200 [Deltaproteobacteria bacterium]|nr:hypothetical protein [Deltaproteobacteria bacterium]